MKVLVTKIALYLMVAAGLLSCSGANLYKELSSNKLSDEALYEDAQKSLDAGSYSDAITAILKTSSGFQAQNRVKESLAGAYAARCGMVFIPFVTKLTGGATASFYKLAMSGFVGISTANFADCKSAEALIEGIGALGARSQSQNLFLLILEMAKIGNRLRADADILPTALGDGTVDASFNCRTSVPIADAQEVMESFLKFIALFTQVGSTMSGANISAISNFINDPANASIVNVTPDYSGGAGAGVDESDPIIIASRLLINTTVFGVGSCASVDTSLCVCP
ncbi:MAG: hypothetical protein EOP06_24700 [Proteobacteria bacterium]|nr:MAG: hypothetical protein EOP06_24700 [Pseudomonadota bacterium]